MRIKPALRIHRSVFAAIVSVLPALAFGQAASLQPSSGVDLDGMVKIERADTGVPASRQLHAGAMHGPTPATIPGGQVITTKGLVALAQTRQAPFVVFDVLGSGESLPNAIPAAWMSQAGSFDDAVQRQAEQALAQATQGRKDTALVFYCLSRECWMSYNASLRAIQAGYKNVLWYRGGLEAWKYAGLYTQQGAQPSVQSSLDSSRFVKVDPVKSRASTAVQAAPADLQIGNGRFFSYALPPGWHVGEDGQYALTVVAPDNKAMTLMVGNAGMPVNTPAGKFAYDKLSAIQPQNLQLSNVRQAVPASGFAQAAEFDVTYQSRGMAWRGIAKVSVAPAYDTSTMVMTAALAPADQWDGYSSWLPRVAAQIAANNGGAFGARGVMAQNLRNSSEYAAAAKSYREWSQKNWQGVVDARNSSTDQQARQRREVLGNVQTFANPYGAQPVELPTSHKYFWTDRQGNVVGTNDPGADPNVGSTGDWRKMERVNP
ncbi:hypothetical protein BH09PSE6_BH09PSE6_00590 [soil metagenome]